MTWLKHVLRPGYMLDPIESTYGDIALEICSFVSGSLDAVSLTNWSVFVGMQTGNTVLLGLSTASLPRDSPYIYAKTLVSITSFLVGAFATFTFHCAAQTSHPGSKPRLLRLHIVLSFTAQALLLILAAALSTTHVVPESHDGRSRTFLESDRRILGALAPLAFQNGMQVATGRLLGFNEIPTIVLTSVYCDLMGDLASMQPVNKKRDRRLGSVVLLFAGAISAGWLMRAGTGVHVVIWIAAGLKMIISIGCWLGLRTVTEKQKEETVAG